jgi:hypothetical protein
MPKQRLTCPVCGHPFELDSGNITFLAKHTTGQIVCGRPCVEIAEASAALMRPVGPAFESLIRRGPESGMRSRTKRRPAGVLFVERAR